MPEAHEKNANIATLERVFGPLERGESQDMGPFFDLFADDAVFKAGANEARGKSAVLRYFVSLGGKLEFNQFVKPLEYFANGNRVVLIGYETVTIRETGAVHEGDFAFVFEFHDGLVTTATNIQDLSGFGEYAAAAAAG